MVWADFLLCHASRLQRQLRIFAHIVCKIMSSFWFRTFRPSCRALSYGFVSLILSCNVLLALITISEWLEVAQRVSLNIFSTAIDEKIGTFSKISKTAEKRALRVKLVGHVSGSAKLRLWIFLSIVVKTFKSDFGSESVFEARQWTKSKWTFRTLHWSRGVLAKEIPVSTFKNFPCRLLNFPFRSSWGKHRGSSENTFSFVSDSDVFRFEIECKSLDFRFDNY